MTRPPAVNRVLVDATSVVLNRDSQVPLAVAEENANLAGASVLKSVRDRLPANLQHVVACYGIQSALMTLHQDANLASAFCSKSTRGLRESFDDIIRAQGRGTQIVQRSASLFNG